jgi:hypothetical protein
LPPHGPTLHRGAPRRRRAPSTPRTAATTLAGAARLVVAVLLVGTALLFVALVGEGIAAASGPLAAGPDVSARPPEPRGRGPTEDADIILPAAEARGGEFLAALLDAEEVLAQPMDPAPGSEVKAAGAVAQALPAAPDAPAGQGGGATVPPWWQGWRRRPPAVAHQPVEIDGAGTDPVRAGRLSASRALPDLVLDTGSSPAPKALPPQTVRNLVDRITSQATSLARTTVKVGGDLAGTGPGRLARSAELHAQAARRLANSAPLTARAELMGAISDLDQISTVASWVGERLEDKGEQLLEHAHLANVWVEVGRAIAGGNKYHPDSDTPLPPMSMGAVAATTADIAKDLADLTRQEAGPVRAGIELGALAKSTRAHATAAVKLGERGSSQARAKVHAALDDLDQLAVVVSTIAFRLVMDGGRLGTAAAGANATVDTALDELGIQPEHRPDWVPTFGEETAPVVPAQSAAEDLGAAQAQEILDARLDPSLDTRAGDQDRAPTPDAASGQGRPAVNEPPRELAGELAGVADGQSRTAPDMTGVHDAAGHQPVVSDSVAAVAGDSSSVSDEAGGDVGEGWAGVDAGAFDSGSFADVG